MQVIKFRGRSIADGSIVYGGVLQYATASYIVQPDTRHADASPRCIEVHPDSVAQYINVKTVDGEEIYTGDIADELGDVLWFVAMMAHRLGFSLEEVMRRNLGKLADRQNRGVIIGDGDKR